MLQSSATRCPPLSRTTPLGTPVVPDVYRMYRGSVALTGTQSTGRAAATASSQSWSPGPSAAACCGRWSSTVALGLCAEMAIASSSSGLYSTIRAISMPQEAVSTTRGFASSIRVASSFAAKPPNTTECTVPSRAQASISTAASGIIGM